MSKEIFDRGLAIRKKVLGAEFVEKSFASADDFNQPMQELTTEYCWGAVWGREGLPHKIRSMLNLAMISCLNRPHELKMHVKGEERRNQGRDPRSFPAGGDLCRDTGWGRLFPHRSRGVRGSRERRLSHDRNRKAREGMR